MRSSFAILCVWICFSVDASTPNGCFKIPEVENAEVSQSSRKDNYSDGCFEIPEVENAEVSQSSRKDNYSDGCFEIPEVENAEVSQSSRKDNYSDVKRCELPEDIPNGQYTIVNGSSFVFRTTIKYICRDGYQMMSRFDTRTCQDGGWDNQLPACEEVSCVPDKIDENMRVEGLPDYDELIKYGHRLTFSCAAHGQIQGPKVVTCQSNGQWSSPFPKCVEVMCVANLPVNMRSDVTEDGHPGPKVSVRPRRTITLSCVGKGLELLGQRKITCLSTGEWNVPFPKCVRGKCGPPPQVDSADTTEMAKTEYNSGERVEYLCFSKYTLDLSPPNSKYLTCEQGEWRGNIKCLKPCSVPVVDMDKRGIELRWGGRQKIFSPHQDRITFACQKGKSFIGSSDLLIQYCTDGEMYLPECVTQGE
ncbi:hypothetical protein R3I93_017257 [Phoxinus phoxinus]|uniref:Sushi domain-containing protein n=1 Tax=Phoxinus phoxinus TaxID=58324 RepID=A0AAN9GYQ3_9TELE